MNKHIVHVPTESVSWPRRREWVHLDDLSRGIFDCPHSTPELTNEGPLLVRSQDIRSGIFQPDGAVHVSEETYAERIARAEPSLGDILYSREGTYFGIAAEVPQGQKICLGQRMVLIRPNPDKMNTRFLRYWLNSPILSRHIQGFRDGSVAERLNMPTIRRLPVPKFLRSEQDAIAETLGSLDDKIELNRRMSDTLQMLMRAIFKAWFIDFEPVKAKAAGASGFRGIPQSVFEDLADHFIESRLGPIPAGWGTGTLLDISDLNPESWSPRSSPDQVEYVDLANTKWGVILKTERFSWDNAPSRARRVLRSGDTIIGTVRPGNGSYALIGRDGLTGSTGFAVLRPKNPYLREQIYCAATSPENIELLAQLADGAAYPAVRPEIVANIDIVLGSRLTVEAFSALNAPLVDRIESNQQESRTLAAIRDALLPKLFSGEIWLRDAEGVDDRE